MKDKILILILIFIAFSILSISCKDEARFDKKNSLVIELYNTFSKEQLECNSDTECVNLYRVYEKKSPDIQLAINKAIINDTVSPNTLTIIGNNDFNQTMDYIVELKNGVLLNEKSSFSFTKSYIDILIALILLSALINNFVFSKYLGLCVFFGVSKRRDTAIGMGITFTIVIMVSVLVSWILYRYVMIPLDLKYLQVIIFIGLVAIFVQFADTIIKKIAPVLFQKFGIYLVLIATNCIILAVPLENAQKYSDDIGSALIYALGAGIGFALAMFLMASAREKLELADIPISFKGLPIAFILTGLFALAFLGFSGLSI